MVSGETSSNPLQGLVKPTPTFKPPSQIRSGAESPKVFPALGPRFTQLWPLEWRVQSLGAGTPVFFALPGPKCPDLWAPSLSGHFSNPDPATSGFYPSGMPTSAPPKDPKPKRWEMLVELGVHWQGRAPSIGCAWALSNQRLSGET